MHLNHIHNYFYTSHSKCKYTICEWTIPFLHLSGFHLDDLISLITANVSKYQILTLEFFLNVLNGHLCIIVLYHCLFRQ